MILGPCECSIKKDMAVVVADRRAFMLCSNRVSGKPGIHPCQVQGLSFLPWCSHRPWGPHSLGCFIRSEATGAWSTSSLSEEVKNARAYRHSHIAFMAYCLNMEELYTLTGRLAANRRPLLLLGVDRGGGGGTLNSTRRAPLAFTAESERKLRY
jgi:hypothetical protein